MALIIGDAFVKKELESVSYLSLRHWNTGLVSSWVSVTSWGEGVFLVLVGYPSSCGATINIPYGVDVLLH